MPSRVVSVERRVVELRIVSTRTEQHGVGGDEQQHVSAVPSKHVCQQSGVGDVQRVPARDEFGVWVGVLHHLSGWVSAVGRSVRGLCSRCEGVFSLFSLIEESFIF